MIKKAIGLNEEGILLADMNEDGAITAEDKFKALGKTYKDTAILETDDGDTVEVLAGYALRSVTVDAKDPTSVTAVLTRAVDGTAAALDALTAQLTQSEKENKLLKAQVSAATDQQSFYEDCIAEMAQIVYA